MAVCQYVHCFAVMKWCGCMSVRTLFCSYENALSGQPPGMVCENCNTPLTLTCPACHVKSQFLDMSKSALNSHSDCDVIGSITSSRVENNGVMETKMEPEEVLSDEQPEPFEMGLGDEGEEEEEEKKR